MLGARGCQEPRLPAGVGHFCAASPALDAELQALHAELAAGAAVQVEIDRRLHACDVAARGWPGVPLAWLYTAAAETVQYATLPDLLRFVCDGVLRQRWDESALHMLVHNALPFIKKGRLFALCFAEAASGVRGAALNVLHGTLLGLFPTCAKRPTFPQRVRVAVEVRRLLVATPGTQAAFLAAVPGLLKLCMLEYVLNACHDFCPEVLAVYMGPRGLEAYVGACANTCDQFRTEALQGETLEWSGLEAQAAVLLDRFARSYKSLLSRVEPRDTADAVHGRVLSAWRKRRDQTARTRLLQLSLVVPVTGVAGGMRHVLSAEATGAQTENTTAAVVEALQHNLQCQLLPGNIVRDALPELTARFNANPHHVYNTSKLHLCLWCVHRLSGSPLAHRLRLDVQRDVLLCAACGDGAAAPVVRVNMLGRLLRLGGVYYHFCTGCLRVRRWEGTGCELRRCECHVVPRAPVSRADDATPPPAGGARAHAFEEANLSRLTSHSLPPRLRRTYQCLVCDRAVSAHTVRVLHVPLRRFVTVFLCQQHYIPPHLGRFIVDTHTLRGVLFPPAS